MFEIVLEEPLARTLMGIPAEIATIVPAFRNLRLEIDMNCPPQNGSIRIVLGNFLLARVMGSKVAGLTSERGV
jgi:hypothetical protein